MHASACIRDQHAIAPRTVPTKAAMMSEVEVACVPGERRVAVGHNTTTRAIFGDCAVRCVNAKGAQERPLCRNLQNS
jgi:hypothetical protein